MSSYKVLVTRSAKKELKRLSKKDTKRIAVALQNLAIEPRPKACLKLKGYDNLWRLRSGNFRIIYSIKDQILIVEVLEIVDRKDAY